MLSVQRTFVTLERALLPVTDRTMLDVLLAQFALKVPRGTSKYLEDVTNKRSTHTGDVSRPARHCRCCEGLVKLALLLSFKCPHCIGGRGIGSASGMWDRQDMFSIECHHNTLG